jgi:hypothetical protein
VKAPSLITVCSGLVICVIAVAGSAGIGDAARQPLDRATIQLAGPGARAATPTSTPRPKTPANAVPQPSATPKPPSFGALDHSIVYDNGVQVILIPASGGGRVGLANISASPYPFNRPRYAGWQFMYYDNAFYLGDVFGHHTPIAAPTASGEKVYDAMPSPDGQFIAWVLVSQAPWDGAMFSMGASRIVLTDQTGGNARVVLQQPIDSVGSVPIIYGWRFGHPPTLLVQSSYGFVGLHKGLEEFNPVLDDLVGDWLPPLGENTYPTGEVLGLSPSGRSIVYARSDSIAPSGEGPLPSAINVLMFDGRKVYQLDLASAHHDKSLPKQPVPSMYAFSRQAFISPDDARVAYTRLDFIYPKGTLTPYIRPVACLATIDGSGKVDLEAGYRVMGWTDSHTLVLRKDDEPDTGLYSFDINSKSKSLIVKGVNLEVNGIVP